MPSENGNDMGSLDISQRTSDPSGVVDVAVEKSFTLQIGQTAQISDLGLDLYFLDVHKDSRCASDVVCDSKGTVGVTLKVSEKGKEDLMLPMNLHNSKDLTPEYALNFVSVEPAKGKSFEEIAKTDYRVTFIVESTLPAYPVIEVENPLGVIFPHQLGNEIWVGREELFTPTIQDVQKAEGIFSQCLADSSLKDENLADIQKKIGSYKRQYVGFVQDGHKMVWMNFFIDNEPLTFKDWKKRIIAVDDGGNSFFNVKVDIDAGECSDFMVNGSA
ncbi:MAG TPA: hypothetical protein PKA32_02165 [Candidatus Gracilibacteria bacterium]|nr:hypothetical protein [Candidatus Gracilibacteria bacterium]